MRRHNIWILILLISLTLMHCSGETEEATVLTADCLKEDFSELGATRTGEIRLFVGDSLWEYINGGAELYHQYGFVEVATADYMLGDLELTADVYLFDDIPGAYGLYTSVRPRSPDIVNVGTQGFADASTASFTKGLYFVRLTAFSSTASSADQLIAFADTLAACLPGAAVRPSAFELFPERNVIIGGDRYYRESFQGRNFLTDVYTQQYALDEEIVTLFLIPDSTQSKYDQWAALDETTPAVAALPYTDGAIQQESYHGQIVAGVVGPYTAGMINYTPDHDAFLSDWLLSLAP